VRLGKPAGKEAQMNQYDARQQFIEGLDRYVSGD
jgi:hypothetical protein